MTSTSAFVCSPLICRADERMADLMERTLREYLDREPLLRRAMVEAFGA